MEKQLGLREQVKKGIITEHAAMDIVRGSGCKTEGWLNRRIIRGSGSRKKK